MRVHPKDNEAINECWISDRDRFSYQGLYSEDRLTTPLLKENGAWREAAWEEALEVAAKGLKAAANSGGEQLGALVSPGSTSEELFLAQKLVRGLGSDNIDFRLRQVDFRDGGPTRPWLGQPIAEMEKADSLLLIGANPRKDQPMLGHRLRKAAMAGATVNYINPLMLDLNYKANQLVSAPAAMVDTLAGIAKALGASGGVIDTAAADAGQTALAEQLKTADTAVVLLGNLATAHPDYSILSSLAGAIAAACGAKLGFLDGASNSMGAHLVGALPRAGLDAMAMLEQPRRGYLLLGVEPGHDFWNPALAQQAFSGADCVVAMTAYRSSSLEAAADVMLPIAGFSETSGTYVNCDGVWQSFTGAVTPMGVARPGWKILRVLGNLLDLDGFDQTNSEQVLSDAQSAAEGEALDNTSEGGLNGERRAQQSGLTRIGDVPIYAVDATVRRATALQQTKDAISAAVRMNAAEAAKAGLAQGDQAALNQDGNRAVMPVEIDPGVPDGCVRVCAALAGTENLGGQFGEVTLEKA